MNQDNNMNRLQQSTDLCLSNDSFDQAELIANDTKKGVCDYQHDPELNIPDKYKCFIWFALPKDIVLMDSNELDI